mmetsp:Transcript_100536/g.173635  ORF Transcript_100536/g.173635 Transcript_100536/m.173635 type:complete len:249 (-) Transcript_100536:381-1127(-)
MHLFEHLLIHLIFAGPFRPVIDYILHLFQVLFNICDEWIGDEIEQLLHSHDVSHPLVPEEVGDVAAILSQEIHGLGVVMLHTLRDVDDVQVSLQPQDIVLREIPVHQSALLIDDAGLFDELHVAAPVLVDVQLDIMQPGGRPTLMPDEVHHQDVLLQDLDLWAQYTCMLQTFEVAALLLSPCPHHLAGVGLAVALAEAEFAANVLIAVFEVEDRRLVHFDGQVLVIHPLRVVDVGLLSGAYAAVDGLA